MAAVAHGEITQNNNYLKDNEQDYRQSLILTPNPVDTASVVNVTHENVIGPLGFSDI